MQRHFSIAWVLFGWLISLSTEAQIIDTLCLSDLEATYHVNGWPGSTYAWQVSNGTISSGSGTDSITVQWNPVLGIQSLDVVEISANGCLGDTQRAQVLIIDPPDLEVVLPNRICSGELFNLTASGGLDYVWNTGDTGSVLRTSVSESTEFTVSSVTQCGSDSAQVVVDPQPLPEVNIQVNGEPDLCEGERTELLAVGNASLWSWSGQGNTQGVLVFEPGYYFLTGLLNGCSSSDSVFIDECRDLVVYNSFTPDGDGINDFLEFEKLDFYPNAQLEIYNRWGDRVFESVGYTQPWDGTWNGSPLPAGSYYYIIDLRDGSEKQSGFINLIRR
jgi:gliding motility-associated-like protein